jgi:pyridoxine/pyridoxamine 5'-phosphate oxidase
MGDLPTRDLGEISAEAWRRIGRGAADARAAFHQMQVATRGTQGWPELRTVILRAADADRRHLVFHTDRRSAKAGEIAADSRVSLHLWDPRAQLQLRVWGQAGIETEGKAVADAWARLAPHQQAVYATALPPGRAIDDPEVADGSPHLPAEEPTGSARRARTEGRGAFAVVTVTAMRFEWLNLRREGHRRARFDWTGAWDGRWLVP